MREALSRLVVGFNRLPKWLRVTLLCACALTVLLGVWTTYFIDSTALKIG